jgi:hypothetical protein
MRRPGHTTCLLSQIARVLTARKWAPEKEKENLSIAKCHKQ